MRRSSLWSAVLTLVLFFAVSACSDTMQSPRSSDSARISAEAAAPSRNAVANQPPVAKAGGPYTGLEGSPVSLSAASSSDPDGDPLSYEWIIGTQCVSTPQVPKDCSPFLLENTQYTWPQNGSYTVQVRVSDGFGGTSTASASVTISNVPPSVDSVLVPSQALVNSTVTLKVRISDPGVNDAPWFVNVKWGDFTGSGTTVNTLANAVTFTHSYASAGNFTIEVAVSDKDNGIGRTTRPIQIGTTLGNTPTGTNVKVQPADPTGAKPLTVTYPTVSASGNTTLGLRQINAAAPNRRFGANPLLYDLATTAQYAGPVSVCLTYDPARFGRAGEARLMMLVGDQWTDITKAGDAAPNTVCGESAGAGTYAVALVNAAPVAMLANVAGINEGGSASFDASGSRDADGDAMTYEWTFGDGSPSVTTSQPAMSHTYADNGTFAVSVVARDGDASGTPATTSVVVANVAPSASFQAPASVSEGSAIALALLGATDPSPVDRAAGFSYAFDCGSGYGAWTSSASASCSTNDNGTRTVRAKLRDKDGGERAYDATVSILNVAPSLGALQGPGGSVKKKTEVSVRGSFTDPGSSDTHTASINWGDGSSSAATVAGGVASGTHVYNNAGTYGVTMVVTDKDGGASAPSTLQIVVTNGNGNGNGNGNAYVVSDDDAAEVSRGATVGAGWIATGSMIDAKGRKDAAKSTFSFEAHSKRVRQRDVCDANIRFSNRDVDFKAKSCDSFTVSGNKALVKGVGSNERGRGTYAYVLSVVDAAGRRDDRFRLKIWDTASGRVLFDNQPGAPIDAPADRKIDDGRIFVKAR